MESAASLFWCPAQLLGVSEPFSVLGVLVFSLFHGPVEQSTYPGSSNGGLRSVTLPMAYEFTRHTIHVVIVARDVFDSSMTKWQMTAMARSTLVNEDMEIRGACAQRICCGKAWYRFHRGGGIVEHHCGIRGVSVRRET